MVKKKEKKEKSKNLNGDVSELKKILKKLTIKYLQGEEKKLPKEKYSKVKKKFMDKVDTLDAINDLKKAIKLLIRKLGKSKELDEIKESLRQIKDKPTPQPQISGGGGAPVITITQPPSQSAPQFVPFPFQGGREFSGFTPEESKKETEAEKKLKDLEKKLKEDRLKEASKKQKEKIDKLKKPKQRDPKEKRDSPPTGPVERLKLTPREFYDLWTPPYMSFEDFIEQDLDALNEDNEEDGIEPISFEDYIQMLEDDNFNVDPEGIGADGFIKDEYLREQFPDIYDNHYGTTTIQNPDGTIKGNETITIRDRVKRGVKDYKAGIKFNKLLKNKYKKAGRGTLNSEDILELVEEAPEILETTKHYFNEYIMPTYEYLKEDGYENLEKLVKVFNVGAATYGLGKVMFKGIGNIRDKFRRQPPPPDNDDDTQPPPPPPPPDMGGGGGGGGDSRRRPTPPPPPPPKEDEDKDEEPEPTTEFDTANIINELSTGISIPSASDISVSEPVVTNMPLTDRIYGVEIPRATSLMTAGVAMLGAVSASGLLTRRLPTPFQEQRYNDRLQRNYEESYADLQEQPATGIGADPRRLLEFEEASRNRNEDTLDLYRDRMRADIRSNTESRLTENRMREEIRSNTETRGLERRRLRESGRERDARQDLGEVIRNQAALRDELVDRQNMPQPVPADLSAHRGVSLQGRFARPPGRPPRNHKWNGETGKYERVLAPDQSTISSYFRVPPQEAIDPNIQEFVQAEDEAFDAEVENIGQELAELRTGMELTPPTEE
jgi:hypothetical protein